MAYKLNVRGASDWVNLLSDLYIELDNTNWSSTTLSGFLDEVQTALDGKKSRNVVKTLLDYSASAYDVVLVDTTDNVTITLPSSASATQGDEIYITDVLGNAKTKEITVARNGNTINGLEEDLMLDVDFASAKLIYDNTTNGWHIDAGGSFLGADNAVFDSSFISLNADFTTGTPTENGGIIIKRGSSDDAILQWNEATDKWQISSDGVTFNDIATGGSVITDHGALSGLNDDDHTQYVHNTIDRTISATHTFNPDSVGAPFVIGANANKQLVDGLNAEYANGILFSTITDTPTAGYTAGDIWFQEVVIVDRSTAALAAANPNFVWTQGDYTFETPYQIDEPATTDWWGTQVNTGPGGLQTGGQTFFNNAAYNFDYVVYSDAGSTVIASGTNVSQYMSPGGIITQSPIWIAIRPTNPSNPLYVEMESQYQ